MMIRQTKWRVLKDFVILRGFGGDINGEGTGTAMVKLVLGALNAKITYRNPRAIDRPD